MGEWVHLGSDNWLPRPATPGRPLVLGCAARSNIGDTVLDLIDSAQQSLSLVSPILSSERILGSLIAARHRRVRVKVISELRDNRGKGVSYPTRGIDHSADAAPLPDHFAAVRRLAANRISCRSLSPYAHAKLVIADEKRVLVSSANLTDNSLGWGAAPSVEAGLVTESPAMAAAWSGAFQELWEACPFRFHLTGTDLSLQRVSAPVPPNFLEPRMVDDDLRLLWAWPARQHGLRDALVSAVREARREVLFVALSFYDTDRIAGLHVAMEEAMSRGVTIRVLVRPEAFRPQDYPDESTKRLIARGLRLFGIKGLHVKGFLADGQKCGIMSANVNPYSLDCDAESAHVECGLTGSAASHLLHPYARLLEQLADSPTHMYHL